MSNSWTIGLPSTVKELIFSHLSLQDRETVRLVCKDWYHAAWSRKLIENDWVRLKRDALTDVRVKMAMMCQVFAAEGAGKPVNFEIGNTKRMLRGSEPFWKFFGPSAVRVKFTDKTIDPQLLACILENAPLLWSLDLGDAIASFPEHLSEPFRAKITENLSSLRGLKGCEQYDSGNYDLFGRFVSSDFDAQNVSVSDKLRQYFDAPQFTDAVVKVPTTKAADAEENLNCIRENPELPLTKLSIFTWKSFAGVPAFSCAISAYDKHVSGEKGLQLQLQTNLAVASDDDVCRSVLEVVSSMHHLRECHIDLPGERFASILQGVVSKNLNLEVLSVNGFPVGDPSWPDTLFAQLQKATFKSFSSCFLQIDGILVKNHSLANFSKHLTTLKLEHCRGLENATVQLICRKCTELRCLKIQRCTPLTAVGLTGGPNLLNTEGEKSFGISHLSRLEVLELSSTEYVTDEGYSACIPELKFDRLRRLHLEIFTLTDDDLLCIARSNPRLETLYAQISRFRRASTGVDLPPREIATYVERFLQLSPCLTAIEVDREGSVRFTAQQMRDIHARFPRLKRLNGCLLVSPSGGSTAA